VQQTASLYKVVISHWAVLVCFNADAIDPLGMLPCCRFNTGPAARNARAVPMLQEFVNPVEKLVARGGADFGDALAALRARALMRRKATL